MTTNRQIVGLVMLVLAEPGGLDPSRQALGF